MCGNGVGVFEWENEDRNAWIELVGWGWEMRGVTTEPNIGAKTPVFSRVLEVRKTILGQLGDKIGGRSVV